MLPDRDMESAALFELLSGGGFAEEGDFADAPPAAQCASAEGAYFQLTELGNSERFIAQHGLNVRYCPTFGRWLTWDGSRWRTDEDGAAVRLAKVTVRTIYQEAAGARTPESRKAISAWAGRSERAAQIAAMLRLAESEPGVPVAVSDLDRDPWALTVRNGVVDLRTGELGPHRRDLLATKICPVEYNPRALAPTWARFLEEVFAPHPDLPAFVQKAAGYSLTGSTREECLFLLHGGGRNGKGVLLKTLGALLSDFAVTADFSTFTARGDDRGPRDDVAAMRGARMVIAQEAREGAAFAESLIKWLTGGDRVRARRLFENSFEFDPSFKLWLASNHKPKIKGSDPAIWSRLRLIPFDVTFEGRENRGLKDELLRELPGILAWAVEGCLRWQEEGLAASEAVVEATSAYRDEMDAVGRFIEERCLIDDACRCRARALYCEYRKWSEGGGDRPMSETAFGLRMKERKFGKDTGRDGSTYLGIGLRGEATSDWHV